jgi:hypothetical protein
MMLVHAKRSPVVALRFVNRLSRPQTCCTRSVMVGSNNNSHSLFCDILPGWGSVRRMAKTRLPEWRCPSCGACCECGTVRDKRIHHAEETSENESPPISKDTLIIYVDGSCSVNQNVATQNCPAGWGAVMIEGRGGRP